MADKSKARLMEFMTIKDVEEGLKKTQTVILPVGCVEQHGWHLPLSTDMYNAIELAKAVSEITGCFVAPLMPYSYSGGALPGTINIAPATISAVINDICRSLAAQGFRNIIVLLGHGGSENLRGIRDGLDICLRHDPSLSQAKVALVPFTDMSPTIAEWFKKKDFHAAAFETSLMLYWHPELVRKPWVTDSEEVMAMLRADQDAYQAVERPVDHPMVMPRIRQDERIKIGVLGDPSQASAEQGERMAQEVIEAMVELIRLMESAQ
ncbi:MAG: creatininase family protein [Firmicutes bacterium]|nr:creatininase family protein [Bacillota bacterium]